MSPAGRIAGKGACLPATSGARTLARASAQGHDRLAMDADHARAIAERVHAADREEAGAALLRHVARVTARTPAEARSVARLHEALESATVTERELLTYELGLQRLHEVIAQESYQRA